MADDELIENEELEPEDTPQDKPENEPEPEPKPEPEKPETGLVHDLGEERRKRHEAETENERLRAQLAEKNEPEPEIKDPLDGLSDDEPVTAGEVRKSHKAQEDRRKAEQIETQKQTANRSYIAAKQELTTDKAGEGLDIDTVMREGAGNLSERDKQVVLAAGEKCMQKMYELCIERTPSLRERKLKHDSQAKPENDKDKDKDKGKSEKGKKTDEEEPVETEDGGEHEELLKFLFEGNSTEEE